MHSFAWWPTVGALAIATVWDLKSRRIPNWLVGPFLVLGIALMGWRGGWHGVGQSLEGAALGLGVFGVLFLLGGMGAGDVKLCAAIGSWIGPGQLLIALAATGMAGGLMALGWAICGGFLGELLGGAARLVFAGRRAGGLRDPAMSVENPRRRRMPYAPAIAVGTLLSFFAR